MRARAQTCCWRDGAIATPNHSNKSLSKIGKLSTTTYRRNAMQCKHTSNVDFDSIFVWHFHECWLMYILIEKFKAIDQFWFWFLFSVIFFFIMWTNSMRPSIRFDSFSIRFDDARLTRWNDNNRRRNERMRSSWNVQVFEKCSSRSQCGRDVHVNNGDCVSLNATKWTTHTHTIE